MVWRADAREEENRMIDRKNPMPLYLQLRDLLHDGTADVSNEIPGAVLRGRA